MRFQDFLLTAAILVNLIEPMPVRAAILPAKVLEVQARDVAWDATRSRFFVSVGGYDPIDPGRPSSIVMVNPDTAQVEDSIPIMETPDRLAISDDGTYLYVALKAQGVVRRYKLPDHSPDLDIPVGVMDRFGPSAVPLALAILPGKPQSIIVGRRYTSPRTQLNGTLVYADVAVYDGSVPRPQVAPISGYPIYDLSVYVRPSSGAIYAYDSQRMHSLALGASGVTVSRSVYGFLNTAGPVSWSGGFASDPYGYVFDLDAGIVTGRVPFQETQNSACIPDVPNRSIYCVETVLGPFAESLGSLTQFSFKDFHATSSAQLDSRLAFTLRLWFGSLRLWGTNGILYFANENPDRTGRGVLVFANSSDLVPIEAAPVPGPVIDTAGVIHVPIPAGGLVYDSQRNLLWASVTGQGGSIANHVVAIDPATGGLGPSIYAGSEPRALAISSDGQRLFTALAGAPLVVPLNLGSLKQEPAFRMIEAPSQNEFTRKYWFATSLATVPGDSDRVVALRVGSPGTGSRDRSVAVFDRSGFRPQKFEEQFGGGLAEVDRLENGDASNALFAYDTTQFSTDRRLVRLLVGVDGVTLDRRLNAVNTDFGAVLVRIVYSDGRFYTSDGAVWTADAKQRMGTVASPGLGFPVVFPELSLVVYVSLSRNMIVAFDLASFRPVSFLPISSQPPFSVVRAGKNAVAIGTASEVLIVPLSLLQALPPLSATFEEVQGGTKFSVPVNDIAVQPGTSNLILATPSADLNLGNSLLTIGARSGQMDAANFAGSEPSLLAAAPDGTFIYAYLRGQGTISRIDLASGKSDLAFSTDFTGGGLPFPVWDMVLGPDGGLAVSYPNGAVAIFDNGVPRRQINGSASGVFFDPSGSYQLAFDDTGANLYGYDQTTSGHNLKRWAVSSQGLQEVTSVNTFDRTWSLEISFSGGFLYTSEGRVIDAERLTPVEGFAEIPGNTMFFFKGSNHVWPDPAMGRVYFVAGNKILVYDMASRARLGSLELPPMFPTKLVKYSGDGLAIRTLGGELYLVRISSIPLAFVPPTITSVRTVYGSSETAQNTWIEIKGANLVPGDTEAGGAFWSSAPEFAEVQMPTQLNGVGVTVNGNPAFVGALCSPVTTAICESDRINVLVPLDDTVGPVQVVVTNGSSASSPFSTTLQAVAPAFFRSDLRGHVLATYADASLPAPLALYPGASRPAHRGETVFLYGTGFGLPAVPLENGSSNQAGPLPALPACTIGSTPATVTAGSLVSPGLYQITVIVPPQVPAGDNSLNCVYAGVAAPQGNLLSVE